MTISFMSIIMATSSSRTFLTTYIFSTDHKIIGRQFLMTGIFWALMGAGMSIIFRLQLGFPEADMAWLRPILGKWIMVNDAGIGKLDPEFYYSLVTMHGTVLVFFVLTAGLERHLFQSAYSATDRRPRHGFSTIERISRTGFSS
jgi:heme/copper-type cytochrome/quinol oxidase subunit 1